MLGARPVPYCCDAILGHGGDSWLALTPTYGRPLASRPLVQPTRAKSLLKLLLVRADGASYAHHPFRWNLTLPDPKVHCISRNAEFIGNFAYLCKSWCHFTRPPGFIKS